MSNTENTQPRLSLADFKLTREFTALSLQQQKYVLKFFENRDALEAVKFAYPKIRDAARMRNRLASDERVQRAIDVWYGVSAKDAMIKSLERDLRRVHSERVRFDLKVLLCKVRGLIQ